MIARILPSVLILVSLFFLQPPLLGETDSINPRQTLRNARLAIEAGDREKALTLLDLVIQAEDSDVSPIARQLHQQLTGAYRERMAFYLNRQIVDQVVLVPDETSLLLAIQQWDKDRFWPVLIEDGWFAPLFIERFKPAKIYRWQADERDLPAIGGQKPAELSDDAWREDIRSRQIERIIRTLAIRQNDSIAKTATTPPGCVLLDPGAPERSAAIALALGRGQPLGLLALQSGERGFVANHDVLITLSKAVATFAKNHGLFSHTQWGAVTLAGRYPMIYHIDDKLGQPFAVDDYLGRDDLGRRSAVIGRLYGEPPRAVYQAMAAMFLPPERTLLIDEYARRGGQPWQSYRLKTAATLIQSDPDGSEPLLLEEETAKITELRKHVYPRHRFDFIWLHSAGGPRRFLLNGPASYREIPIGRAAAFYVVHSFSAADPRDVDTMAGRALAGGGFWYYGSMYEPYLNAFSRPTGVAMRARAGTPLAMVVRAGPTDSISRPWRLTLIGDPLYAFNQTPSARRPPAPPLLADPVKPTDHDASRLAHYRDLLLTDLPEAAPLALAWLTDSPEMIPSDLLRITALLALESDRAELVASLPLEMINRDPLLPSIVEELWHRRIREAIRNDQPQLATVSLAHLLRLTVAVDDTADLLKQWAGDDASRRDVMLSWYEQGEFLSTAGRSALRKALK